MREDSEARPDILGELLEAVDITRLSEALATDLSVRVYADDLAALVPAAMDRMTGRIDPETAFSIRSAFHYLLGALHTDGFVLQVVGFKIYALTPDGPVEITDEEIRRATWLVEVASDARLAARVLEVVGG